MDREPGWSEAKQMEWFNLKLEPGSEAEEWFDELKASEKTDMATLKPLFDAAYPPNPKATESVQDKWDRLLKHTLEKDHMLDVDEDGVHEYVKWSVHMLTISTDPGPTSETHPKACGRGVNVQRPRSQGPGGKKEGPRGSNGRQSRGDGAQARASIIKEQPATDTRRCS